MSPDWNRAGGSFHILKNMEPDHTQGFPNSQLIIARGCVHDSSGGTPIRSNLLSLDTLDNKITVILTQVYA